jgi:DNA repair protein RadC
MFGADPDHVPIVGAGAFRYSGAMRYQRAELPLKLDGLGAARKFFAGCFGEFEGERETLWVAHVDEQARCIHLSRHDGEEAGMDFPLRAIIADAAEHGSAGMVLAHNHPSGDPRPSDSDLRATRRLASAAEALDCTVLDHLVFAGSDCTSLRRLGYL